MKFIHLADAHLDSPFRGLSFLPSTAFKKIYRAADQSFTKIVDLAISENVDLVLIAGDTFDSAHPSPRSQLFFAKQIKKLTDQKIQVVMIFGNHDHMDQNDLLVTPSPYFKLLGNKEQVETASFKTRDGFAYQIVGFSYLHNHIEEDMIQHFPAKSEFYTFGLMHAQEKAANGNVYAPFNLSELQELNYNYFALGHIHARRILSHQPLIVYPGNIQGRHVNELGAKGCYLGEIDESTKETKIVFHETSPIVWKAVNIKITSTLSRNALRNKLLEVGEIKQTTYFSIRLQGAEFLDEEETELVQNEEFLQNLSASLPDNSQIVDLRFVSEKQAIELQSSDQDYFVQAEKELFAKNHFMQIVRDWAKKDEVAQTAIANPQFLNDVRDLTKVKLMQVMKGLNDASKEN